MDFIRRALLSMKAKKGRTLLLSAVFSAILIFVLAGLTIRSAALSATENAKKSVGATVTLSTNRQNGMERSEGEDGSERPDPSSFTVTPVNLEDAEKISALDNVKSYSFISSSSAGATDDITPISSSDDSEDENTAASSSTATEGEGMMGGAPGGEMMGGGEAGGAAAMMQSDFQVTGVMELSMYSGFSEGTSSIVEGEAITAEDEGTNNIVIEQTLAEANELSVGDTFTITSPEDEETTYEVTIKGIYETSESSSSMGTMFNFLNPANMLYSSYTFANTLKGDDSEGTIDSASYTLSDPESMDQFVAEAEKLVDTETFSLQTNDQMYQQMLQPLNNVASFATNIVVLVAVAGVIILTLIVMMTIRERRYEIGVLLSMGEARVKVIMQFFTEILVCMLFALVVASFSGNIVGNVIGEQLLEQQTESTQTASNDNEMGQGGPSGNRGGGNFGSIGASSQEAAQEIQEMDITVTADQIVMLAGMGILISFGSILLSSIGIIRLQPRKILTT
ncbi:FtsX-like permease family protein [Enterococcus sp. BWM-S5]|uniref:FtsX-like permease family protein n=1 Tax=Enterococcus larvae TaxID=2794352 RepID=A0ABS4CHZ3_9ENTE|nr:FtsX-like permease family protein [Enterococcus larvae]MBP1045882.1 FtsX-like permease family protein [Enterococcus larvae]